MSKRIVEDSKFNFNVASSDDIVFQKPTRIPKRKQVISDTGLFLLEDESETVSAPGSRRQSASSRLSFESHTLVHQSRILYPLKN